MWPSLIQNLLVASWVQLHHLWLRWNPALTVSSGWTQWLITKKAEACTSPVSSRLILFHVYQNPFILQFFNCIFPTSTAKAGSLEDSHLGTFKRQASCLGLLQGVHCLHHGTHTHTHARTALHSQQLFSFRSVPSCPRCKGGKRE